MKKKEKNFIKSKILKCLTQDFTYGTRKDGKPLKHPKTNQAIFDKEEGWQVFARTDLEMVMEAVVLGLSFAQADLEKDE